MNADGAPARRGVDAAAIALVLLIPTLLFADVLFGGKRLYDRDITAYHYPMKSMVRRAMLSGEFPYWNPLFAGGQPLAANPAYELFYPPQWLILLPDYDLGFRLSIVIHFYIAALGMYLLLRSIALTPLSASFGSITFTLSGLLSSLTNLLPYLSSVAWMPLIVLFVLRFLRTKSSRDFALAALFLSMQVLCGEPMTLFQTEVLVLVIGLSQAREARAGAAATLRSVVSCLAIILAASLTGAAQLLPMIDHAGDSVRSLGFSFDSATGWSTPLIRVFEFVFPHWMGSVADGGAHYWGASYYQPATSAFIASFYVGLLAFALAVGGIICRSRGWSLTVGVFGGSLLLAAGRNTPVYRLLFHLPFFSATRYPEKYLIAGVFVLIVFASTVLDRLVTGDAAMARTLRIVTLALAAISALALMVSFLPKYEPWFKLLWQIPESARI
ncbi:MAG TPA: hypothetical protein VHL58_01765, partial [Thermoanaerobaculia bacterium]|nr:hypothetical protein [Thermoanaerobaculia bacterium]